LASRAITCSVYALRRAAIVNTCDEQSDLPPMPGASARLGVVCITYCVGGLKVANTTAEAFAEKSPVVVTAARPA
jgi:indolepyruvate decarboxylase